MRGGGVRPHFTGSGGIARPAAAGAVAGDAVLRGSASYAGVSRLNQVTGLVVFGDWT